MHWLKRFWQLRAQPPWAIIFFGMGVKLPAKLIVIENKRIIAAALSLNDQKGRCAVMTASHEKV
jgi:hypothetical protein